MRLRHVGVPCWWLQAAAPKSATCQPLPSRVESTLPACKSWCTTCWLCMCCKAEATWYAFFTISFIPSLQPISYIHTQHRLHYNVTILPSTGTSNRSCWLTEACISLLSSSSSSLNERCHECMKAAIMMHCHCTCSIPCVANANSKCRHTNETKWGGRFEHPELVFALCVAHNLNILTHNWCGLLT